MTETWIHDSAWGHVSGTSRFVDDQPWQRGELQVGVVTSPVASASLRGFNQDELSHLDGVFAVVTADQLKNNLWGAIRHDQPILANQTLSYIGEPIALVLAESRQAMTRALAQVRVEFEALPSILSREQARQQQAFLAPPLVIRRGDAHEAIAHADHRLQGRFHSKGQDHFYLESQAAYVEPVDFGHLLVKCSSQHPTEVQHLVAEALGLSFNQVVCQVDRMGGAFGGKESQASHYAVLCALACQVSGRPCRLVLSKDEDMIATGKRHPFYAEWQVGFDQQGRILGLDVELCSDGGAFLDLSLPIMQRALLHLDNAYYLPHVTMKGRVCRTHVAPNTAFRGFGGPQGMMIMESLLEDIAHYLALDSHEVRRINLYGGPDRDVTPYGQVVDHKELQHLVDALEVSSDYRKRYQDIVQWNAQHPYEARGIALTPVKFGISFTLKSLNQGNALVQLHLDGSLQVSTGATEMGQGVQAKIGFLVAEAFGVSSKAVRVLAPSTAKNHNTSATAASSGSDINGAAALAACVKIKQRLAGFFRWYHSFAIDQRPNPFGKDDPPSFDSAATTADGVSFVDGDVIDQRGHRLTLAEVACLCHQFRVSLGDYGFYKTQGIHFDWQVGRGQPFLYFTTGAAVSEVRVDLLTGDIKVTRVDILMDLGRPIIEGIDRGQVIGGFIQGMGWVTTEDLCYDDKGYLMTHSPTTYKIPNIQDLPRQFNVDLVAGRVNPVNVRGSKAVGEPPFLLCASVYAAIKKALLSVKKSRHCAEKPLGLPVTGEEALRFLAPGTYPDDRREKGSATHCK